MAAALPPPSGESMEAMRKELEATGMPQEKIQTLTDWQVLNAVAQVRKSQGEGGIPAQKPAPVAGIVQMSIKPVIQGAVVPVAESPAARHRFQPIAPDAADAAAIPAPVIATTLEAIGAIAGITKTILLQPMTQDQKKKFDEAYAVLSAVAPAAMNKDMATAWKQAQAIQKIITHLRSATTTQELIESLKKEPFPGDGWVVRYTTKAEKGSKLLLCNGDSANPKQSYVVDILKLP